jgi:hypothetical protein
MIHRKEIFVDNYQKIQAHNSRDDVTYTLAVHHHADLTFEEFKAKYTGARPPNKNSNNVQTLSEPIVKGKKASNAFYRVGMISK